MREVITRQKYKCDFCKRRSTKSVMEKHEKRCFRNPNRFCDFCENSGFTWERENDTDYKVDCPYCAKRDPEMEKEIAKYEAGKERQQPLQESEIPF